MTPWTAAHQASLSFTISWSLLKLMFIELVMLSNYLILCCFLLFLPLVFPSIRCECLRQDKQTGPIRESAVGSQGSGSALCSLDAGDISRKDHTAYAPPSWRPEPCGSHNKGLYSHPLQSSTALSQICSCEVMGLCRRDLCCAKAPICTQKEGFEGSSRL